MSTSNHSTELCHAVDEHIASIIDGSGDAALLEHIAECDRCRDLRHDATSVARAITDAGGDYQHPADFEKLLFDKLAQLDVAPRADVQATAAMNEHKEPPVVAPPQRVDEPAAVSSAEQNMPAKVVTESMPQMPSDTVSEAKSKPLPMPSLAQAAPKRSSRVIGFAIVGLTSLAAAAALILHFGSSRPDGESAMGATDSWTGRVASLRHAGAQEGGLQRCALDETGCVTLTEGAELEARSLIRTDGRTRVHLELSDGTTVAMDRSTKLELRDARGRVAFLREGVVVADVAHLEGAPPARFDLPNGSIEVLGTKFTLTSDGDRSAVEVVRGVVRATAADGDTALVRAGEEATIRQRKVDVVPAASLGESVVWSERGEGDGEQELTARGVGELRARKPGEKTEKSHAVRLTKHEVKIRIAGSVARTEIDETFSNDTGDVLEGIYRFPLPPDAQIERLALEVDGKLEEGAFVDRDRAAKIWRGVIHAAAPKTMVARDEIIWVPGPWRDPALLEWQRGGRFELRIYPIPARGSRRVVLAYTQTIAPSAGVRRFTYPLSYDATGTTRIDDFRMNVSVRGHDEQNGVHVRGYDLRSVDGSDPGARRLEMAASSFVPSGDLTVEYALPQDEREVTAWAYRPDGATEALGASANESAYVALAIRPRLPRWADDKARDQVLVVDASRSMVGERLRRAGSLAEAIVREMDRRDRFAVLACDTTCVEMSSELAAPGPAAAREVRSFVERLEPEGGTDLVEAVARARSFAQKSGGRELRVIYIGDGTPSVGAVRAPHIAQEVARVLPPGHGMLTAVAVGSDADTQSLAAMARGGGGVLVPYASGERASAVALRVLGASYGIALRNPVLDLPEGLTDVYPRTIDNIPAGGETIVVARMSANRVDGSIKMRGKVGGETYEQSFPIQVMATSAKGNAFVPRLYGATKIVDLEATQGENAKTELVELSKKFSVASKFTSMLVLESPAMFQAFGIDRSTGNMPSWTGDEAAESSGADGLTAYADKDDSFSGLPYGGGGGAAGPKKSSSPPKPKAAAEAWAAPPPGGMAADEAAPPMAAPPPRPRPSPTVAAPPRDPWAEEQSRRERRGNWVPMRRVWDRKGSVSVDTEPVKSALAKALAEAEADGAANPDNRAKLEKLFGLYAMTGRLDRASELAEQWSRRDALDPGAIVARAELAARAGDRKRALRILGGLADVRPGDPATQNWLASAMESMGDEGRACAHRVALAGARSTDAASVARAVACARTNGRSMLGDLLLADVAADARASVEKELAKAQPSRALRGDVSVEATWDDEADLDVALVGKNGQRYSWLGDPEGRVSVQGATSLRSEKIAIFNAPRGEYVIEVTRSEASEAAAPLRGTLTVKAAGTTRSIPFVLSGTRAEVGSVRIFYSSRLVPADTW